MPIKLFSLLLMVLTSSAICSSLSLAETQIDPVREMEGKNAVEMINRSQQAYHVERQKFARYLTEFPVVIPENPYYSQPIITIKDNLATVVVNAQQNDLRSYSGGVVYDNAEYSQIICQNIAPGKEIRPPFLGVNQLTCPPGSRMVR